MRQQTRRLTANQDIILKDLQDRLHQDSLVTYIFAEHPAIAWDYAICDCVIDIQNSHQIFLRVNFFLDGRWQITGPTTTCDNKIIIVPNSITTTDLWYVADFCTSITAEAKREGPEKEAITVPYNSALGAQQH
jgi:hypothetical protein